MSDIVGALKRWVVVRLRDNNEQAWMRASHKVPTEDPHGWSCFIAIRVGAGTKDRNNKDSSNRNEYSIEER